MGPFKAPSKDASVANNDTRASGQFGSSSYVLNRNYAAATRLNSQHLLWKMEIGWLLHPLLVPTPSFRVADLGTGTAIWPLDLAQSLPMAQVDGFDIDLEQCPPSEWLPHNVTIREWDAFSALPPELENQYDVVHLRLLLLVVRDNDPRAILRNALRMLKKGGWLQWDELDPWGAYVVEAGKQQADRTGHWFQKAQEPTPMATLQWVTDLPSIMEEMGFEDINREEIVCDLRLVKYFQDIQFMVLEELAANTAMKDENNVVDTIKGIMQNSHRGKARVTPKAVFLALLHFQRRRQIHLHGCAPPRNLPQIDPIFGLDAIFQTLPFSRRIIGSASLGQQFSTYGTTFQCQTYNTTRLYTIAPRNLQSVFSTDFDSWGVAPLRFFFFEPFVGNGIMTADGPFWNHSRTLLKPTFSRAQISDLSAYSVHVGHLLTGLLKHNDLDLDLRPYFEKLALDSSTEFLFGHSTGALTPNPTLDAQAFLRSFNYGQAGIGKRMKLPKWNFLTRDKRFWHSCTLARAFVERCVAQASASRTNPTYKPPSRLVLAHQLLAETTDQRDIVNQLLNVFMPAHDATAVALTNIFFHLSRHPAIYAVLRREILALGPHTTWTFERLKGCKYLQAVMNETSRLNPSIGQMARAALRDTVLPTGGGSDGAAPIFVKKGTVLMTSFYALHRSRERWGQDAELWRPERWLKDGRDALKKAENWTFMPFGGGPRICIGMQLGLTEVAYAVGRVVERFQMVECRDPVWEFMEEWKLSTVSRNGAKVRLVQA
ncbi:MAG: hypothetical protein Q9202_007338 [Teloschistes flavicans]